MQFFAVRLNPGFGVFDAEPRSGDAAKSDG